MSSVLSFTPVAIDYLRGLVNKQSALGFRFSVSKDGCSGLYYKPSVIHELIEGDLAWEVEGLAVYVDPDCVDFVSGTEIDFIDKGLGQKQIVFNNPNAKGECGCGESFRVDDEEAES